MKNQGTMKRETEISKTNKNILSLSNIDLDKTEWIMQYGDDIIFIHNPSFKFCNHEPYKLGQLMAVICEEGSASGTVNLKPYQLKKNSFLIVLSSHIAEAYDVSDDFKGTYIFMSEQFLRRLDIGDSYKFYESVDNTPLFHFDEQTAASLRLYIDLSRAIYQQKDKNPNTVEAIRLLTKLFFLMLGWFIHPIAESNDSDARHLTVMNDFIKIVKQHYKENRDVEFYARRMNMTAKYMSTQIKKASGKSALQWIEDYVILDAKAQLASTMNSIQQITYDLNFPTQSYFGRYFKRAVGMSPSEYRRSARKANTDTKIQSDGEPCYNR